MYKILILLIILFIVIINLKLFGSEDFNYSIYDRNISGIYHKTMGAKKEIHKENLFLTDDILKKYNIDYNLSDGTALGSVREKDIIEKDEDVDIEIDIDLLNKFKSIVEEFKKKGFKIVRFWENKKLNSNRRVNLISLYRKYHYIDFQFSGKGLYCISINDNPPRLCDEFLDLKYPYQKGFIGDREFKSPSEKYLELLYGKDWRIPKHKFKPNNIKRYN